MHRTPTMSEPLRTETPMHVGPAPPCTLVIFGAHGDLTKRLLMPALYNLVVAGHLPDAFRILGVDHNHDSDEGWRRLLTETIHGFAKDPTAEFHPDRIDEGAWGFVRDRLDYQKGDFEAEETYRSLAASIDGNAIFYLAVSARFFGPIVDRLGAAGLLREREGAFRRVVVEKPFGSDLASARDLNARLLAQAGEGQIFRIDHFLGKETVQSLLVLRFANRILEPAWNRDHIDCVEITAAETIGVEERGGFYETIGALRDMVPNHLFQLLCMAAMEPPASLASEDVRDTKAALIRSIRPAVPSEAVRGQYGAGDDAGHSVSAYRDEPDVDPGSTTETYVALRLMIDSPRWDGVPFYLRTGKRLSGRRTEIVIHFKDPTTDLFDAEAGLRSGFMRLRIDPEHGVATTLNAKRPGPGISLGQVIAGFDYGDFFAEKPTVGYETLLYDCMVGDSTLFQRADMIEGAWAIVDPLIQAWRAAPVVSYPAGSDGPDAANALLAPDGRAWSRLDGR